MAQVLRPNTAGGLFATDGKPHPLQDTLLAVTLVLGITSFVTALVDDDLHLLSSWTGLVGILTGAYGQWISETTRERFGLILGLGAAGVGFFLGMAHGGLFGGLID
ncbi:membrane protein [Streptomyces olindensis]|nr:membrane protein [Streptomyces olindensis]